MTTYDYLSKISRYEALIEGQLEEIKNLRAMAENITVAIDSERVQSSGDKDRIGKIVAKIVDKENELSGMIDMCYEERSKIISQMQEMKEPSEYKVLFYKFVSHLDMDTVSEKVGYSNPHIYRVYKNAMRHFEELHGTSYLNDSQ